MKALSILALFLASFTAQAAVVGECGSLNSLEYIVEPLEAYTKTYANGTVRIVYVDTYGEPACCSSHLLVLVRQNDELGTTACYVVSNQKLEDDYYLGFQSVDFKKISASYDAGKGLLLNVPYTQYVDGIDSNKGNARVRINLGLGTAKLE